MKSGLNPDPSSSNAATFPLTSKLPDDWRKVPAINCIKVLFPEPFKPMIPRHCDLLSSKETSFKAKKTFFGKFCSRMTLKKIFKQFTKSSAGILTIDLFFLINLRDFLKL